MPLSVVTLYWAWGPKAIKLGSKNNGYGMSLQVVDSVHTWLYVFMSVQYCFQRSGRQRDGR